MQIEDTHIVTIVIRDAYVGFGEASNDISTFLFLVQPSPSFVTHKKLLQSEEKLLNTFMPKLDIVIDYKMIVLQI